jgi:HSP20 family protein
MTGRKNPFEDIEEMIERMSRQFEESMGGGAMEKLGGGGASVDVADRGDEFVVTADLPGYREEDIDVTLRGDHLQIRAESEREPSEESDEEDGRYIRKERSHRSVNRTVTFPDDVDEENVSAEFRNGVLTVTLRKMTASDEDSHSIDIE